LRFSERWRLAGIISSEVRFQGYLEMNPSNLARVKEDPEKIARSIKSNSRFNTFITTFMVLSLAIVTSVMAIFDTDVGIPQTRLAVGLSMFLILSFVLLVFLNLSVTTGFFTADVMNFPATLPLTKRTLDELSLLAFIRVFIAPTILILTIFPVLILLAIGPVSALVAFVACAATVSLSLGTLTKISSWFRRKSLQVDDSRANTLVRVSASLGLAIGMVTVFSMGSWLPSMIHFIADLSSGIGTQGSSFLALLFPFSFGFLASAAQFGLSISIETILMALGGSAIYSLLAIVSYRRTGNALREITVGGVPTKRTLELREVTLSTDSPLKAIVRKDLKLATRNIGSSFVFIIPLFLVIFIYPMMAGWSTNEPLRSLTALISIEYGNFFAGITIISIMMFDTQGASIMAGLPLRSKRVLDAKVAIAMIPYVGSMIVIFILLSMFPLTSPLIPLIPLIQIPCGYTIAVTAGTSVYWKRGGGRAVAINVVADTKMSFIAALIGAIVGIVPLVGYGVAMILTGNHIASLITQVLVIILELILIRSQVPKLLKD
jgi:predicted permease